MNQFTAQEWIDFSSPMIPASGQQVVDSIGFFEKVVMSLKKDSTKRQKAFSLLQLVIGLVITLFVAGIVVPSLLRSAVATNEAFTNGSLHTIRIAGLMFSYTYKNVAFAILGALVGATGAFAIASPATSHKSTTTLRLGRSIASAS